MLVLFKAVASALAIAPVFAGPLSLDPRTNNHAVKAPLVVQTSSGIIHGAVNESAPLTRQFLGIPYALPIFGENRFKEPQLFPKSAAKQVIYADAFGPSCPQYETTVPVWAPLYPKEEKVPVIIWIYEGGQTTGGSSVPYQNPQYWVQRTQSHIVVSLQYRLNFFGQPNTPTENAGLYNFDARAALNGFRTTLPLLAVTFHEGALGPVCKCDFDWCSQHWLAG